jgi:hypothetical protein
MNSYGRKDFYVHRLPYQKSKPMLFLNDTIHKSQHWPQVHEHPVSRGRDQVGGRGERRQQPPPLQQPVRHARLRRVPAVFLFFFWFTWILRFLKYFCDKWRFFVFSQNRKCRQRHGALQTELFAKAEEPTGERVLPGNRQRSKVW